MILHPAVAYGGLILGLLTILISVYFTGRAIGQKSNGYVRQGDCQDNMSGLHDKFNSVIKDVSEIKGYLKKKL